MDPFSLNDSRELNVSEMKQLLKTEKERNYAAQRMLKDAKETIESLRKRQDSTLSINDSSFSPISRHSRSVLSESTFDGEESMQMIQQQLNLITGQLQNIGSASQQAQFKLLKERNAKMEEELKELKQLLNEKDLTALDGNLIELQNENKELKKEKELLRGEIIKLETKIEELNRERSVLLDKMEDERMSNQKSSLEKMFMLKKENEQLLQNKVDLETKLSLLKKENTNLLESTKQKHENQITELKIQMEQSLERQKKEYENTLNLLMNEKNLIASRFNEERKMLTDQMSTEKRQKEIFQDQYEKLVNENQQLTKKIMNESVVTKNVDKLDSSYKKEIAKVHKEHLEKLEQLKSLIKNSDNSKEDDIKLIKESLAQEIMRMNKYFEEGNRYTRTEEEVQSLKSYCTHLEHEISTLNEQNKLLNSKIKDLTKALMDGTSPPLGEEFKHKKQVSFQLGSIDELYDNAEDIDLDISLNQSISNQQSFDEQMELLSKKMEEILKDSEVKIEQFISNLTASNTHSVIDLHKRHTHIKKVLQMEYWTAIRRLRFKPNSSIMFVPRARKMFLNAVDRVDVAFMSLLSTLSMLDDPKEVSNKEIEKLYTLEMNRTKLITTMSDSIEKEITSKYDMDIHVAKEDIKEQENQLNVLMEAIHKLGKVKSNTKQLAEDEIYNKCLSQLEALQREEKINIRKKIYKVISTLTIENGVNISNVIELMLLREEQVTKLLDAYSDILSKKTTSHINNDNNFVTDKISTDSRLVDKLHKRVKEICQAIGEDFGNLDKDMSSLLEKLKLVPNRLMKKESATITNFEELDNNLRKKPVPLKKWLENSGEDKEENLGVANKLLDLDASPIRSRSPPKKRNIDPILNFEYNPLEEEKDLIDFEEKDGLLIDSPLKRKLEGRYKALLTVLKDDLLKVKSFSDVVPKVRSLLHHNTQMYSFILTLLNSNEPLRKFGFFVLDNSSEKVIDLDQLYSDIIWYRKFYACVKREVSVAGREDQTELYYKLKGIIRELKEKPKVISGSSEASHEKEIIIKLRKILNVQYSHEIIDQCERMVAQLRKYITIFPKFQNLINELCIGLNVTRIEDVIPSVKRLIKISKNVNLLL
ncbi:hypothetical protein ABK040_014699 [Willaertia magna]